MRLRLAWDVVLGLFAFTYVTLAAMQVVDANPWAMGLGMGVLLVIAFPPERQP